MHNFNNCLHMNTYKQQVQSILRQLPERHRIAFAAWCCERLFPWYDSLAISAGLTGSTALRTVVDIIWSCSTLTILDYDQLIAIQDQCDAIDLGEEDCSIFRMAAMDAVGAAMLAIEVCKRPDVDEVAKVSQCIVNVIHGEIMAVVWQLYNRSLNPSDIATIESQIAIHPIMLSELRHQSQALFLLQHTPEINQETIRQLIDLARQ